LFADHRLDLRDPSTTPLNFTKSINLSLSERGINAMRHSGRADLIEKVKKEVLPMRGRMIHGKKANGELYEQSQEYDAHGRVCPILDLLITTTDHNSRQTLRQTVENSTKSFSTSSN